MYKSFFAKAVMSAFFSAAALHGAGVAVELDGRNSKIIKEIEDLNNTVNFIRCSRTFCSIAAE